MESSPEHRNRRLGLALFAVYFVLYAAFVWLVCFRHEVMAERHAPGWVNVAVAYGIALIAAAVILAVVYMMRCRPEPPEPRP